MLLLRFAAMPRNRSRSHRNIRADTSRDFSLHVRSHVKIIVLQYRLCIVSTSTVIIIQWLKVGTRTVRIRIIITTCGCDFLRGGIETPSSREY